MARYYGGDQTQAHADIVSVVDLVIQLQVMPDGTRRVTKIAGVSSHLATTANGRPQVSISPLYELAGDQRTYHRKPLDDSLRNQLQAAGIDDSRLAVATAGTETIGH